MEIAESKVTIVWQRSADGVVTLVLDDPTQRVNTLNAALIDDLRQVVERLNDEVESVTGVIVRSAKASFLAGGDLNRLLAVETKDREQFFADLQRRKAITRRLEQLGRPVVALIEGPALGGGLELALACHRRIGVRSARLAVGLPEASLGLLPGGGGVVRTTRLLGEDAAASLVMSGARMSGEDALSIGLLDELADDSFSAWQAALRWIRGNPSPQQPWDDASPDLGIPRNHPVSLAQSAPRRGWAHRQLAPGPWVVDELLRDVARTQFDAALELESSYFADLVVHPSAKRTIGVSFFDTVAARSRAKATTEAGRGFACYAVDAASTALCNAAGLDLLTGSADPSQPTDPGPMGVVAVSGDTSVDVPENGLVVRISQDALDPDSYVLEYHAPDDVAGALAAWLAKSGALVIRVKTIGPSFKHQVRTAIDAECERLRSEGATTAALRRGLDASGLTTHDQQRRVDDSSGERSTGGSAGDSALEVALRLLDVAAGAAQQAGVVLVDPADLDVVTVRLAGLPAFTGGANRWLARTDLLVVSPAAPDPRPSVPIDELDRVFLTNE